jgi:hypothetical protein
MRRLILPLPQAVALTLAAGAIDGRKFYNNSAHISNAGFPA